MLTRAGWSVAIGAVIGLAAGRVLGVTELYVLSAVAAVLLLVALAWVRRPAPQLAVTRRVHPARITVGMPGRVEVAITNRGSRQVPPVSIIDPVEGTVGARMAVGPLAQGARQEVGYRLPPLRRGLLHIGPLSTELIDPFGLARRRFAGSSEQVVTVFPTIDPAPTLPVGGGRHEPLAGLTNRVITASGVEDLVTLRPYVVGDDLRRVHWPSTAHADELQVRRDEERWQGHLTVVLDARAGVLGPDDFERAISATAGIVHAVAAAGDRVRLAITDGSDTGMVEAQRTTHSILEDLALLAQHGDIGDEDDFDGELPTADARRPSTVVVLTGAQPGQIIRALGDRGFRDALVVRYADRDDALPSLGAVPCVTVLPGEPLGRAWGRAARTGPDPRPDEDRDATAGIR